jgi:hypothetical protein
MDPDCDSYNMASTPGQLIANYSAFNPHATFVLNGQRYEATNTTWPKWKTNMPTSAHWYNVQTLSDLISGYVAKGLKKTIREFVSEFRGLSSTAKQKKVTEGHSHTYLDQFIHNGDIEREAVGELLDRMKKESTAPKASKLGVIGSDHFKSWIISTGGNPESFEYFKKADYDDEGLPYVIEQAFAVNENIENNRTILTGLNWSPVIGDQPDRILSGAIQEARLDPHDPVFYLVHIARPRFEFMDRGKTRTEL